MNLTRLHACSFAVWLVGCSADMPPQTTSESSSIDEDFRARSRCTLTDCGTNSPFIGHELALRAGKPNTEGVRFVSASHLCADKPAKIAVAVIDDELYVTVDGVALGTSDLPGLVLTLDDDGTRIAVTLLEVSEMPMWVDDGEVVVPSYKFIYEANGKTELLCPYPSEGEPGDPEGLDAARERLAKVCDRDTPNDLAYHAVLFAGDRYDPETAEVATDPIDPVWFNWGCRGSAAAKLHLTGHTRAADVRLGHSTSHVAKQAALYAFTATYCPGTERFTVPGQALRYADVRGLLPRDGDNSFLPSALGTIDAVWTETGAFCIGDPRRAADEPGVRGDIAAACPKIPACADRIDPESPDPNASLLALARPIVTFNLCGDGVAAGAELCDGTDLPGRDDLRDHDCRSLGFASGTPSCAADCSAIVGCSDWSGDCCESHPTPRCEDIACTEAVCAADPYCCDVMWDGLCSHAASGLADCADASGSC